MRVTRSAVSVLALCTFVFSIVSEEIFVVKTELVGPDKAKLSWEDIPDTDGNIPARYRVLCTSPDSPAVEAVSKEKTVELSTLKEGLTYTCEVHPIFNDLVEGMDVISANPGTSAPFTMHFQSADPAPEKISNEEETTPPVVTTQAEAKVTEAPTTTATTKQTEETVIPQVTAAPSVKAKALNAVSAKVEWTVVEDNSIPASRYRVVCKTNDSSRRIIQIASTTENSVVMDTFEPGLEYACSVYAIWDNLLSGVEAVSSTPGVSELFQMPSRAGCLLVWTTPFLTIFTILLNQVPTYH